MNAQILFHKVAGAYSKFSKRAIETANSLSDRVFDPETYCMPVDKEEMGGNNREIYKRLLLEAEAEGVLAFRLAASELTAPPLELATNIEAAQELEDTLKLRPSHFSEAKCRRIHGDGAYTKRIAQAYLYSPSRPSEGPPFIIETELAKYDANIVGILVSEKDSSKSFFIYASAEYPNRSGGMLANMRPVRFPEACI